MAKIRTVLKSSYPDEQILNKLIFFVVKGSKKYRGKTTVLELKVTAESKFEFSIQMSS